MRSVAAALLGVILLAGCAAPNIAALRSTPPDGSFTVEAPLQCLYEKGVEHVGSYMGMSEPKFTWFINAQGTQAWFRQPLTLVQLDARGTNATEVTRFQTSSATTFKQGNDLMQYLRGNPCAPGK